MEQSPRICLTSLALLWFVRIICIVACSCNVFIFIALQYFIVSVYFFFFFSVLSTLGEHLLGTFQFQAVQTGAATNTSTCLQENIHMRSVDYMSWSGIAGISAMHLFHQSRYQQVVFQSNVSVYTPTNRYESSGYSVSQPAFVIFLSFLFLLFWCRVLVFPYDFNFHFPDDQ